MGLLFTPENLGHLENTEKFYQIFKTGYFFHITPVAILVRSHVVYRAFHGFGRAKFPDGAPAASQNTARFIGGQI